LQWLTEEIQNRNFLFLWCVSFFLNFVNEIQESITTSELENEQLRNQLQATEESIIGQNRQRQEEVAAYVREIGNVKALIGPLQIDVAAHRQDEAVARSEEAAALARAAAARARELVKRQAVVDIETQMRHGLRSIGVNI